MIDPRTLLSLDTRDIIKIGMMTLKPHLQETGGKSRGKVVIGTVKGNLHNISKISDSLMYDIGEDVFEIAGAKPSWEK